MGNKIAVFAVLALFAWACSAQPQFLPATGTEVIDNPVEVDVPVGGSAPPVFPSVPAGDSVDGEMMPAAIERDAGSAEVAPSTATSIRVPSDPGPPPSPTPSRAASDFGQSVNELAARIARRLRDANGSKSTLFSPLSIAASFSLIYPGAAGVTREELGNVFGFQSEQIISSLAEKANNVGAATLANRAYFAPDVQISPAYKEAIGSSLGEVDFSSPQAAQEINSWVDGVTNGLLGDLVPEGFLTPAVRLVLVNAIYFGGSWAEPFPKYLSKQDVFNGASGPRSVDFMMYDGFRRFRSKKLPQAQMLDFPYDDGKHSMFVILPDSKDGWLSVEQQVVSQLSPSFFLDDFAENLEFTVKMPKWEFEASIENLPTILSDLGLTSLFSNADLSSITTAEPLFVSDALLKAKIRVDEEGTEAAAGTLTAVATSLPPPAEDFFMDRPFLYFIVDLSDGTILFQGTVTEI